MMMKPSIFFCTVAIVLGLSVSADARIAAPTKERPVSAEPTSKVHGAGRATRSPRKLSAASFVGRWRGGEGTYMKIERRGGGYVIDNQWGLDADMQGVFTATLTSKGLSFRRNGRTETVRPGVGDAVNRSALRGKKDCLIVGPDEGYCRF